MNPEQVQMFVNITGASEDVARDKLQAHNGNLNAAINSFYNDGEPLIPVYRGDTDGPQWMEEDEPPVRQPSVPFPSYPPLPLNSPAWSGGLPALGGIGSAENQASQYPVGETAPFVSHTRNSRELPIDWRDNTEPRVRSRAVILESENAHLPSQSPTDFVSDEDEVSGPASAVLRAQHDSLPFERIRSGAEYGFSNASPIAPLPDIAHNEGADIEEEMIKAAMEASKNESSGLPIFREGQGGSNLDGPGRHSEDDEMAWALSQSLKTAEEEQEMRRRLVDGGILEQGSDHPLSPPRGSDYEQLPRDGSTPGSKESIFTGSSGPSSRNSLPSAFAVSNNVVRQISSRANVEDGDELEEPLLRRRPSRRVVSTPSPNAEDSSSFLGPQGNQIVDVNLSSAAQENGHNRQYDEWGGLSSEEQDEAVMLEAAMFGALPDNVAARFRYPLNAGRVVEDADLSDDGGLPNYPRPIQQPPSPTVIAQRLLREQQDDEYLASLEADREKEARAQREEELRHLKEAEAKVAALEQDRLRQEEEMHKVLAAEELERRLAAKRAALPVEPPMDDEAAVTLMVRMPDGSRQGRRFRKSEHLQCLFDFIDVSGAVVPGSYRLVRPYPRKAFTDGEHNSSFQDLELSGRNEVLFLELV